MDDRRQKDKPRYGKSAAVGGIRDSATTAIPSSSKATQHFMNGLQETSYYKKRVRCTRLYKCTQNGTQTSSQLANVVVIVALSVNLDAGPCLRPQQSIRSSGLYPSSLPPCVCCRNARPWRARHLNPAVTPASAPPSSPIQTTHPARV